MDNIESTIRELGQKRKQSELQEYVRKLDTKNLVSFIISKYKSSNFSYVWYYLMQAFTDSSDSHKKRFQVVSTLLHELEKGLLSTSQCNEILTRLCPELPKFKPEHVIQICNFCIECIQKGTVSEMCWKDVLPQSLNVIVKCPHIEYNDQDMTGLEYKTQLVNSLCMLVWSPSIITSLASMFTEMPLTKDEHSQVVNKLGQYMEKLTCQELPAFIYQMLKLCRYQNSRSIFLRLQYYFGVRIYSRKELTANSDSESTNIDAIDDTANQDAIEAESTIIFHIHQSASEGIECIKDYLTSLKNLVKSPEFILHPFQFTVLLTISTVPTCEEKVMEILRSSISRAIQEDLKKNDTCWFREMISSTCKIEDIIQQVIECSVNGRYLVVQGLVQLAYILLGISPMLGREGDLLCERQWELGKMILLKVIKTNRKIAPCIITSLNNHIITGQNVLQYIDFIRILCEKMSLIMLENQSCVIELIEYLVQVPGTTASHIFDAVLPLTKISPTIRDHLILLLRKALHSCTIETRQMAVSGFLKLIKELKISNLTALSQSSNSSSSGHSLLTQASLSCSGKATTNVFSNEALCLEVLGILRRCFMQQAEVRSQLYDGLYYAVCVNPELGIPVLGMLWWHFNKFYVSDEETIPPLQFSTITITKDLDVKLQEPLGKLIYTMGLILIKVQDDDDDIVAKLRNVLESLCNRMANCELIHLELDDGTDLLDVIPESKHKLLILLESLCVYEGLIGYKICSWGPTTERNSQQINSLFQGYTRLMEFSKNLTKSKKGDKRKQTNDSRDSDQTHPNGTLKENPTRNSFKKPNTILDFETLTRMLSLLHNPTVSWTTPAEANILKTKCEIHQHIMEASLQLVKKLKSFKTEDVRYKKMCFNFLTDIAGILYERCIVRLDSFLDFDTLTASLALECFYLILKVIGVHYKPKFSLFLSSLVNKSIDEDLSNLLQALIETYQKLFILEDIESSSDVEIKKLLLIIMNTITLLSSHIPPTNNSLSNKLLEWLKNFANKNIISNKQVVSSLISLLFSTQIKFKNTTILYENVVCRLSSILGTINEVEENSDELILINEANALTVFPLLCNSLKTLLDDVDWIIIRLKSKFGMITYPGEDNPERRKEYLKSKERGVCCQLCPIITILGTMCNIKVPPGTLSEMLLKTVTHLYNSLNGLTKYFLARSSKVNLVFQGARFERVVKLAGKQLSTVVYDYITYIEEFNKQKTQNTQTKKKSVNSDLLKNKVLRETRLIPKVVYDIEQFGKSVIQLSNKTQVDLGKLVGQGSARDFRIRGLLEVLAQAKSNDGNNTTANVSTESETSMDVDENVLEETSSSNSPTVSKKRRKT
ncbi:hypothetical protein RN001_006128 [Aquatica leii]|uniref:Fanconi anemia group I protein n=1 Tax=Aquatica leii TaxID=1421715 RepID=A0AAN7SJJ7_9COLE|nr:hypothetical protein RN001_006128 [Aquatica leii]